MLLKYLGVLCLLASVALFAQAPFRSVAAWWRRRIENYARWFAIEIQLMFEEMTPDRARRLITSMIVGAAAFGFLLGKGLIGRLAVALLLGCVGYLGPWALVAWRRRKRLSAIDDQMVDALLMMANGLKAGLSLQQSLELVVREMKPPISDEFGRLVKEIHLGRLMDDALRRIAERVPLEDVKLVVESVLTLRETGGNLSDTFQVISQTVVERKKVEGKIKAITAQGMTQGILVCSMPVAMMLLFSAIDVRYMTPFFTTPLGWLMLLVVMALDGAGMWLMLTLVKVDV